MAGPAAAVQAVKLPPMGQSVANTSPALAALKDLHDVDTALGLTTDGALLYQRQKVKLDGYEYCSLAVALAEKGEFRLSARAASQALYVGLQSHNPDLQAKAWRDLAIAYGYAGSLDHAEEFARKALALKAKVPSQVEGPAWKVIADVQARRGKYAEALKSYTKALQTSSDRYRPLVRLSQVNALIDAGQLPAARQAFALVHTDDDAVLETQARRTDAKLLLKEGKPTAARKLYQQLATASSGPNAAWVRFWAQVGIGRSDLALGDHTRGLDTLTGALGGLESVRARFHSGEFKMGLFSDVQKVFDEAVGLYASQQDAAQAFDLSERSRSRALLDAVRGRAKVPAARRTTVTVAQLRKLLHPDERVLEFHVLHDRLLLWVVAPGGITQHHYPITSAQLTQLVGAFRSAIIHGKSGAVGAADAIGKLLIAPLGLADGLRLIVIPYGPLHYLPFQALRVGGHYLIENHPISVAPSISVAVQLLEQSHRLAPQLVAFGDPKVAPRFALPGSKAEVEALAALFPQARVFLGAQATKARLEQDASSARLLHIAAHAEADSIDPLYSRILLASSNGQVHFLEARDVMGLHLAHPGLVTLSACESGLGRIADGDEVLGFTRAFLSAGTSAMVASLWPVSDKATKLLMTTLYRNLAQGVDLQKSMQLAQLAVLHTKGMAFPFFWAPFNVIGDWRLTLARSP